ncbi:uncharacterized protein N7469_003046 [Penicillium citrinum]|uniref:Uncharacterized protein n=1 Tax=Penicillium citrinum TaxID=5077 RepID=A0A9W9PBQ4_PENCI|nr:uncharacterized protein N7469_003046 [Penicillium citrinum]KAJ5241455.1 hypothetical protein N7469_003046 [Penicillium citrinum]
MGVLAGATLVIFHKSEPSGGPRIATQVALIGYESPGMQESVSRYIKSIGTTTTVSRSHAPV